MPLYEQAVQAERAYLIRALATTTTTPSSASTVPMATAAAQLRADQRAVTSPRQNSSAMLRTKAAYSTPALRSLLV